MADWNPLKKLKFIKFEGLKVNMIIFLTWLVIMPIIIFKEFTIFPFWVNIALFGLVLLGMLASILYFRKTDAWRKLSYDERTERFLLKSARNGFLMAVLLTTFLAALAWLRGSQMDTLFLLLWIWSWVTSTYMLSYIYYVTVE
jgi:hypothetical protein